jgi:hypothetical protein
MDPMTAGIVALFLVGPLVVVPLGLRLIDRSREGATDRLMRISLLGSVPSAISLAMAFTLPAGPLSALLAIPWLGVASLAGGSAVVEFIQDRAYLRPTPRRATEVARGFLVVGAVFALADRAGVRPLDFTATIILLTAVHFHFAGFALVLAGALAWRARPGPAMGFALWTLIIGIPLTALGFFGLPLVAWIGVILVASGAIGVALGMLVLGSAMSRGARALATVAGVALLVSMPLAIVYTTGTLVGATWLDVPTMASVHGTLNALGFSVPAMLAWTIEGRYGS